MPEQSRRTVDAVHTACDILDVLQTRERAGVTEIAEEVGLAKGAVHRHLVTLNNREYVVNEDGEYRLSLRYLDMANQVKGMVGNYDVIAGELQNLAEATGEIAQFATEEHGWVTYVYKSTGDSGIQTASSAGKREYMHSTSLGKAMLAEMDEERARDILADHEMPKKTEHTCTDAEALMELLSDVRERGYALDNEENITGLRCVGMPLTDSDSDVFGAVSVSGPVSRMTDERIDSEIAETLERSTNVIEINSKFA
ncbi:IclR family transcriptional regulator [Halarchaeum grantii]|uniref:IclR family transcriptional regulator n=1 Tax=Halarchaeum grantii TaxID=1193105 RepID=A0A830EZ59_9EURY|nr:IclR family transcriptional regulator [Halarchaeum grantii]GGL39024.1 IclR family transcriptional regulator [Halarchaeum grantii]